MKIAVFCVLLVHLSTSCGGPEWEFVYEHDAELTIQALSCGTGSFVLAARRGNFLSRPSLIFHDAGTTHEANPAGEWVWSLSRPGALLLFATTIDARLAGARTSRLFRSIDGGRAWTNLPFPTQDAFGVGFATAEMGLAWTEQEAFYSKDGGRSWDSIPRVREALGPRLISRQHPSPLVTARGELFLPLSGSMPTNTRRATSCV